MEIPTYPDELDHVGEALIRGLEAEVARLRVELENSDVIRSALVDSTCGVAKDMVRALNLVEAAFHAGVALGKTGAIEQFDSIDHAFKSWSQAIMK